MTETKELIIDEPTKFNERLEYIKAMTHRIVNTLKETKNQDVLITMRQEALGKDGALTRWCGWLRDLGWAPRLTMGNAINKCSYDIETAYEAAVKALIPTEPELTPETLETKQLALASFLRDTLTNIVTAEDLETLMGVYQSTFSTVQKFLFDGLHEKVTDVNSVINNTYWDRYLAITGSKHPGDYRGLETTQAIKEESKSDLLETLKRAESETELINKQLSSICARLNDIEIKLSRSSVDVEVKKIKKYLRGLIERCKNEIRRSGFQKGWKGYWLDKKKYLTKKEKQQLTYALDRTSPTSETQYWLNKIDKQYGLTTEELMLLKRIIHFPVFVAIISNPITKFGFKCALYITQKITPSFAMYNGKAVFSRMKRK